MVLRREPFALVREPGPKVQELERLIRQGAGGQDVADRQPGGAGAAAAPNAASLAYELNVEFKHLKILVPQLESFVGLAGLEVLDFGCGTGGVSVAVCSRGASVTGVDPIAANLGAASARARVYGLEDLIRFEHLRDGPRLPFADAAFDLCIANSVFEYIHQDRGVHLAEIWRVLRPGGIFYLGDTSNGIYPRERHSGRWLINYRPGLARRQRCVSGVSYWEIERLLRGRPHRVLNLDQPGRALAALLERHGQGGAKSAMLRAALCLAQNLLCRPWGLPLEAWLPWLNLAIQKA